MPFTKFLKNIDFSPEPAGQGLNARLEGPPNGRNVIAEKDFGRGTGR
jgi:hypothetical protein